MLYGFLFCLNITKENVKYGKGITLSFALLKRKKVKATLLPNVLHSKWKGLIPTRDTGLVLHGKQQYLGLEQCTIPVDKSIHPRKKESMVVRLLRWQPQVSTETLH